MICDADRVGVRQVRQTERIRPGRTAEKYLFREWGMCRWVWNELVAESQRQYTAAGRALAAGADPGELPMFGYAEQDRYLTHLRRSTTDPRTGERWLAMGSSVAQQQTVRDFSRARAKALKDRKAKPPNARRSGLPRFKSRRIALPSLNYTQRGFSLKPHPDTGRLMLVLPGGVRIPVVWTRELPSEPKSVRVYQDSLGHWYASFTVEIDETVHHLPSAEEERAIGIDWGVTETATTVVVDMRTGRVDESDTYDLPHAQHGRRAAGKLARYQRMMARRRAPKGRAATRGYRKARRLAARAYKKLARRRQDEARKWAKRLVHPSNTTSDCASCGARTKHRLPLGERTYTCTTCGVVRPRDKNSAAVMVVRAGFLPADVEGVRPEPALERVRAA